jgi:hexosaminidase
VQKVEDHFARLDSMNVNYSLAMYDPIISVKENSGKLQIALQAEVPGLTIHFTYDNTIPNKYSPAYNGEPIVYPSGADNFRVVSYRNGKPIGRLISLTTEELQKRVKK